MRTSLRLIALVLVGLVAAPSSADARRVACVGDSITQGNANADVARNSWPQILQRLLDANHPGRYEVGNFGRSGATALREGSRPYWNDDAYARALEFAPQIVVINLGTNDAASRNWQTRGGAFRSDYDDLIEVFAALDSKPVIWLSTLTPVYGRFLDAEYGAARMEVEASIAALAARHGLPVIDLTTPLLEQPLLFPDGLHPNTAGNEIVAMAVGSALTGTAMPRDASLRPRAVSGDDVALVIGGRALAVELGTWSEQDGVIQGHGAKKRCTATWSIGAGDFHLRARLRMLEQENSAAGFFLDADFFGFEGARGTLFRNGPHLGGVRLLHPAPLVFPRDDWIDFEVVRNDDQIWFMINGIIADMALLPGPIETMGFDPTRSTMQIESWTVTGRVEPHRPEHLDRRTVACPWIDLARQPERVTIAPARERPPAAPALALTLPRDPPVSLQGTGHVARELDDGRLMIAFRDGHAASPTFGDLVVWVGTPEDLGRRREGAYTARLFDNPDEPGALDTVALERHDDGAYTATVDWDGREGHRHVSVRFRAEDLDALVPTPGSRIPLVDLDADPRRHVVVDREPGQYLGHVTTALLEDDRTILAVYPKGHGRGPIVYKRSDDGGRTWSPRLPTPENWATSREVPTIHRVIDPDSGRRRLIVWSGLHPARLAHSEDDGATWSPLEPVGDWGGIVVMGFVERLAHGDYLAMFHDDGRFFTAENRRVDPPVFTLYQTISADGGLTWSHPAPVWSGRDLHLCEPGCIRSPDGSTLAVLLRENSRSRNAHVIFSTNEGASWSAPRELPASLTGDRHTARYAPDGRIFISFRDTARESPTQGDWVGWVGTWADILRGRPGQYRVRIKDNRHRWDTTYPGVEVLSDGTFVVTTYGHWVDGEEPYILSARFTLAELDARVGVD